MGVDRRFLYWGTFFIAMGAIALVVQSRLVDGLLLDRAWQLWPLVLVALGVGLLLRRTRLALPAGMLMAAVPGLAIGGLIAAGPQMTLGCASGGTPASMVARQGTFADSGQANLTLRCGQVSVVTAPGSGWQLETGNTENVAADVVTSPTGLSVASGRPQGWVLNGRDVWRLTLPTTVPVDLSLQVDAGQGRLNLAGAQLRDLSVTANAGDVRADLTGTTIGSVSVDVNAGATSVQLPDGDLSGTFTVNAGSLKICAPAGLGLRIDSRTSLGSAHYPGLIQSGSTWESADYASAAHRADISASVNLGSIQLNPAGGCQ